MRLHLGCGNKLWKDYTNIDFKGGDLACDIRVLPFADGVASEIVAIHVVEHFFITEVLSVLKEWHRVLSDDGVLIIELPCWDKVQRLIKADAPDNFTRWALYGQPETHVDGVPALHKWCWSIDEFREVLEAAGFVNIELEQPKFHQPVRDMRWVAIK